MDNQGNINTQYNYPPPPPRRRNRGGGYASDYNETPQPEQPKSSNKGWIIACFVMLFLLVIGGGGVAYYIHTDNLNAAAERAYDALADSYDSQDYQAFLDRFPDSVYVPEVRRRMQRLQTMESEWYSIKNSSNANAFVRFKNRFPNPLYDRLCDEKIDSLDWIAAREDNTWNAYDVYMKKHPSGQYYADASNAQTLCPNPQQVRDSIRAAKEVFVSDDTLNLDDLLNDVF